jgi:hypothetical protein
VRAACILVLVLAACGGSGTAESPLEHVVAHLQEHGFEAAEVPPQGDPRPEAMAVVQLQGGTATIYAYGTEEAARTATTRFAAEEQAAPARVRVQREGAFVFVGRAPEGKGLPAVDFEDVVFTAEEDH